jgi:predicted nucleic-acid-binding protein
MVYADANIIVRYIINDDETMAAKAEEAINAKKLFVIPEVFAEVVYVLTKVYKIDRSAVATAMQELLAYVSTSVPEIMRNAFTYYNESKLDFVDCILASYKLTDEKEILSFDKKLNNFIARKETEE